MLKKLLTLLAAFTMLWCFSTTAFAAEDEAEQIAPLDTIITGVSLQGDNNPTLLYQGYTLLGGTITITNVYASPGPVRIRVINSASQDVAPEQTIGLSQSATFPVPAFTGTFKVVVYAETAGVYYFNLSGPIIYNPDPDVQVKLVDVEDTDEFYLISELNTGILPVTLTLANSAFSAGSIDVLVLDSLNQQVALVENIAPGGGTSIPLSGLLGFDRYYLYVSGDTEGIYQVSYTTN